MIVTMPGGKKIIIEVTVCKDELVTERHLEKKRKYDLLAQDMARQDHAHPNVIIVAIGATGAVSKNGLKDLVKLKELGIPIRISRLQRSAAYGSVRILNKILAMK